MSSCHHNTSTPSSKWQTTLTCHHRIGDSRIKGVLKQEVAVEVPVGAEAEVEGKGERGRE